MMKRIHIFKQNKKNIEKKRKFILKKIKGEYLMILNSNDFFKKSMIEELFIKIKENDDEIVIFNSNEFKIENDKKNH